MTTGILIRETRLDDAPEVIRHRRFMFRDMGYRDETALDAMQSTSEPYLLARMQDGTYRGWFAQTAEGRVAGGGGVLLYPWVTNPCDPNLMRAYLLNVYVYEEFRRRGVARRLMDMMMEWCRAQGFATVWLHASDESRPLYQSMGFAATNEMKLTFGPQTLPEEG
ncbi:MAG: GNAT family N-acetyltransferase [Acidobacteria bacterium]|nr:GNAT family N-acetyltransferase [Acidobacteriota bacterium]